ncbi:hypothetical protein ACFOWM_03440 [Ferruginibacter yonginensis]|uniref:Uncharacterized protein n=1 Tax=Ferruginibacter yonginensis TaxID=1310416 RepID=A0ABV8QQL6_9BACT
MKQLLFIAALLVASSILSGNGKRTDYAKANEIAKLSKQLPDNERRLVDSILYNDRVINNKLEVLQDIAKP